MKEDIQNLRNQALAQILEASSASEIEELRIKFLGRKGELQTLFKSLVNLSTEEKKTTGELLNDTKKTINEALTDRKNSLNTNQREWFDATIPGTKPILGNTHLVTQAIRKVSTIFESIGFTRKRYPEVEWDWFAFESLNMPKEHPARDEWETFFVDTKPHPKYGKMLLTPHTSSGQVREMLNMGTPPIRMINIAKCYRRQSDVTHVPMFHQFEGLVIDKNINLTHLKGTIDYFAKNFYGEGTKSRIRPFHFQFTEPSFEVDFSCVHCGGKGCSFCKSGWHEVGGAGMVHPNVLKSGGIDPSEYSGFAFGWGVERTLLLTPGIGLSDLRTLYTTDVRILSQY